MTFERSSAGQSNRARFFRADLICYVEGNPEIHSSVDVAYWQAVFASVAPGVKIHFTARGGKPILESLAAKIIDEQVSDTIIAMDRDYSEFREGRFLTDARVFYTYGYSWENDVFAEEQMEIILCRATRSNSVPVSFVNTLKNDYANLNSGVGKLVFADFAAILRGGSVLDRKRPGRYFERDAHGRPSICKDRCLVDVKAANTRLAQNTSRPATAYPREGSRYLWGKALEHYIRIGLNSSISAICRKSIGSEHLRDLAIMCFGVRLASKEKSTLLEYYRECWKRFTLKPI